MWTDPAVFAVNKERGRALPHGYVDRRDIPTEYVPTLGAGDIPTRLDLGGPWQFRWVQGLRGFDMDAAGRVGAGPDDGTVPVPGVWQLAGYGVPYYLAMTYPPSIGKRPGRIPRIDPDRNEAGIYTREVEVPRAWIADRLTVVFEGVKAGFGLFVNGRFVGYSQGSFLPAEFDLTDHLRAGSNVLTAVVLRYTDGTYLEDQDMWFFSGIFRPVWLHRQPRTRIHDIAVRSEPVDAGRAVVRCAVTVARDAGEPAEPLVVEVRVGAGDGPVAAAAVRATVAPGESRVLALDIPLSDPQFWSAEHPDLYDVVAAVAVAGADRHAVRLRTGIRRVEIRDEQILINGSPVIFYGVNRHDFDPDRGWAVPAHRYRDDLLTAKRLNINAIRTSHYPNPQILYDLCDELGLYVMDECDLETHGVRRRNVPGDDPRWTAAVVDRMERMVLADRNHPSIIMWSLGNEAGLGGRDGGNFAAMRRAAQSLDDSRPFHYEGDHNPGISDVVSRMYATSEQMAALGRHEGLRFGIGTKVTNRLFTDEKDIDAPDLIGRPVLLCEYAHAMENSLGNFGDYIEVFHTYRNLAGGFIWDYVDQTLRRPGPDGDRWLYGGDFGEKPHHRYFCANGILAADRSPHPSAHEVFWGYRPVAVVPLDAARGRVRVHNRYHHSDLGHLSATAEVRVDGAPVIEDRLAPPSCPPGGSVDWTVPLGGLLVQAGVTEGADTVVRLVWRESADRPWHPAGSIVAFDEFAVPPPARRARPVPVAVPADPARSSAARSVTSSDGVLIARCGAGEIMVSERFGAVLGWRVAGRQVLRSPLRPNFWRALTDNDRGLANIDRRLEPLLIDRAWRRPRIRVSGIDTRSGPDGVSVVARLRARRLFAGELTGTIGADGALTVRWRVLPHKDMYRVGVTLAVADVRSVRWFGRGPHENYIDRHDGAWTAIHELPLAQMETRYVRPQENGNRTEVRWAQFAGADRLLRVADPTGGLLGFTAWPYSQEHLDATEHTHELVRGDDVTINIDRLQRGVGGDLPGVAALKPRYTIPAGRVHEMAARFEVLPIAAGAGR